MLIQVNQQSIDCKSKKRAMAFEQSPKSTVLSVEQFVEYFFPKLIEELKNTLDVSVNEAQKLSEKVIVRLKSRFRTNKAHSISVFQKAISNIVSSESKKYKRLMDQNFGLSEEAFYEMLAQLKKGDETLYERIFLNHFDACMKFVERKYNASHNDAYDASMDTMLVFCRKLKQGTIEYGNLRFLFTQIAGQIYLKMVKKNKKIDTIAGLEIEDEMSGYDQESFKILSQAFDKMGERCSELIKQFYYNEQSLKEIAEQNNKTAVAVRKQKQRCMEKLRDFFNQLS